MPIDSALISDEIADREEPRNHRSVASLWPEWHAQARCLGQDDTLFFGATSPDERPAYTKSAITKAKAQCAQCPVFEQCLRDAIRNREVYGVFAGTTMKERSRIFAMISRGETTEELVITTLLREHHA